MPTKKEKMRRIKWKLRLYRAKTQRRETQNEEQCKATKRKERISRKQFQKQKRKMSVNRKQANNVEEEDEAKPYESAKRMAKNCRWEIERRVNRDWKERVKKTDERSMNNWRLL